MKPQYFPKPTLIPEQPLSVEDEDNEQSRLVVTSSIFTHSQFQ